MYIYRAKILFLGFMWDKKMVKGRGAQGGITIIERKAKKKKKVKPNKSSSYESVTEKKLKLLMFPDDF